MWHTGPLRVGLHELVLDEVRGYRQVLVRLRIMQETVVSCAYIEQHAERR
jgi:hypothetical protein